ncbi:Vacuolar amino acid transporter 2 [Hyphodiscus hymeniophilus]|uniref:Vacuolar amino acid transporter 2 n=1 Tax=Hyphodiscus hymeniophilus TaxID=353542 RepID=A0A9P6VQP6_9HELO|nr:Vacuolar amino acid transporter 2 [Hyphodiscus hymeniophilus]
MAKAKTHPILRNGENPVEAPNEEDRGLLSGNSSEDEDIIVHPGRSSPQEEPRTPRTPNRVRFDLPPAIDTDDSNDTAPPPPYNDSPLSGHRHPRQQFVPLLTDIEAPSVTLAASPWGNDEDVDEWAERERQRPKSGLRSAFMNMANSIIGAGIIGQPYAFRQAGLLTGVILLIALTITVDWTIRLIVINSKLSGSNSFQGTVQHCFGKTGLIAISIAQWAFAFGGMVAFGVIVGDTIPHVLVAIWPGLGNVPVLGLLANRRVVIVVFILGISYPLSLYRDIAKWSVPSHRRDIICTGISMLACLLMALAGFLTFGSKTEGNVLNNFPTDNIMVNIARLCFGLNMLTTLPLEAFVCREVMFNYWFPGEPFNMNLHLMFSTSLVYEELEDDSRRCMCGIWICGYGH